MGTVYLYGDCIAKTKRDKEFFMNLCVHLSIHRYKQRYSFLPELLLDTKHDQYCQLTVE